MPAALDIDKKANPTITDDHVALAYGANQYKVNFTQLREVLNMSEWAQANILVAVAGSANDGTSGVRESADQTLRREIVRERRRRLEARRRPAPTKIVTIGEELNLIAVVRGRPPIGRGSVEWKAGEPEKR